MRRGLTRLFVAAGVFFLLVSVGATQSATPATAQDTDHPVLRGVQSPTFDQHRTWRDYGGGPDQSKYVALNQITPENVANLERAWFYPTGDENRYQFNPVIVDSVMYVLAKGNSLVALNAATGEELWIHAHLRGIARRGINYWENADRSDRRLLFQMNDYLQAVDARTGESILTFGDDGLVDLREGLDRDPATVARVQSGTPGKIFEDLIILGSSPGENYLSAPGHIRAYNVITGEHVWTFRTIPHPGEYGYETWPEDAYRYVGGANAWGEISVDVERGIAFVPTGSPTYDYYGADRIGRNLFGSSLLALDARTGERLWHYQTVHHDLWDYDLAAAPQLITIRRGGREIDAVAVAGKTGYLYVFNRETGEPLWPIEERPVPPSDVPGEQAWPTQPIPAVIPPFAHQEMTAEDLNPYFLTPEERADWTARLDTLVRTGRTGLFTPLSDKHETLALPGAVGGASWGNTAADPDEGIVYVYSIDWPSVYPKLDRRDADAEPARSESMHPVQRGREIYAQSCETCHGADQAGTAVGPSLRGLERRFGLADFEQIVRSGQGEMPAFAHLDEEAAEALYRFLGGTRDGEVVELPEGPVVASGGAPGGQAVRPVTVQGGRLGPPYPEGVDVPEHRYYIDGWGLEYSYIIRPPWSSITAYDLSRGTVRWKRPIGLDKHAAAEGGTNTGVLQAQRNGMIVTSTGLVFSTAKDWKIYAFDADDGDVLWSGDLSTGTEGLPALYEVNGRAYLVVTATTPLQWGRPGAEDDPDPEEPRPQGGYVVFSLPE
ncbi:MAG: PQQ-binding-like beta-propeller repeat protein [Verrucomicrobiales bacterium]